MLKLANVISCGNIVAVPGAAIEVRCHHKQPSPLPESVRSVLLKNRIMKNVFEENKHLSFAEELICMLGNPCTERGGEENHVCKFFTILNTLQVDFLQTGKIQRSQLFHQTRSLSHIAALQPT